MSDYGLKIVNASLTTTLDTTDRISRLVYQTKATGNVNGSVNLPAIVGHKVVTVAVPVNLLDSSSNIIGHTVTASLGVVSWVNQTHNTSYGYTDSEIFVFMYT